MSKSVCRHKRFNMNFKCTSNSKAALDDYGSSRCEEGGSDDIVMHIAVVSAAHQLNKFTQMCHEAAEELLGLPSIPNLEVSTKKILAMKCMKDKKDRNYRRVAVFELSKWVGIMLNQTL